MLACLRTMHLARRRRPARQSRRPKPMQFLFGLLPRQRFLAAGDLLVEGTALAMSQLRKEPHLSDESWRSFILEKEANSALARAEWARYRRGLRRLEAKYRRRVPLPALRRELAEDAFFCGAHWRQKPRIVRAALHSLLDFRPDLRLYVFAAAEYWAWASAVSPNDLAAADQMVERARVAMKNQSLEPAVRDNLEQMLVRMVR